VRRTPRSPISKIRRCLCTAEGDELCNCISEVLRQNAFRCSLSGVRPFLEMPKGLKARKHVTSRIVTQEDVENLLLAAKRAYEKGDIDAHHYGNYRAIILFGALAGQRPQATIAKLTVQQFREAIQQDKAVLDVLPAQDKIRMQHYCSLHPQVVEAVTTLFDDGARNLMFKQLSFERWLKERQLALIRCGSHFVPGDLRKFCEQMGDILQWDQSNKNYILTHGVSGVDWRFTNTHFPIRFMVSIWNTGEA